MNNKIWVVTYYNIGEQEPTVTCFNNKENNFKVTEKLFKWKGQE